MIYSFKTSLKFSWSAQGNLILFCCTLTTHRRSSRMLFHLSLVLSGTGFCPAPLLTATPAVLLLSGREHPCLQRFCWTAKSVLVSAFLFVHRQLTLINTDYSPFLHFIIVVFEPNFALECNNVIDSHCSVPRSMEARSPCQEKGISLWCTYKIAFSEVTFQNQCLIIQHRGVSSCLSPCFEP